MQSNCCNSFENVGEFIEFWTQLSKLESLSNGRTRNDNVDFATEVAFQCDEIFSNLPQHRGQGEFVNWFPALRVNSWNDFVSKTMKFRMQCSSFVTVASESQALNCKLTCAVETEETWLILPVVICLSQRLSHACLSISFYLVKLRMAH